MAPLNLFLSGPEPGSYDLVWSSPAELSLNSQFQIVGCNVYRSFDSEFGPYDRLTDLPSGVNYCRDVTDNRLEVDEVVDADDWLLRGVSGSFNYPRYILRTKYSPIVKPGSKAVPTNIARDVEVTVDGVRARILRVDGVAGEVELDVTTYPDVETQRAVPPVVPGPNSVVKITYSRNSNLVNKELFQRVFYRVTTLAQTSSGLIETPLEHAATCSSYETEKLDYIWAEAVRRNAWILNQAGERVRLFIHKTAGHPCPCTTVSTSRQPKGDCTRCFGVGFIGGYEGPFNIIIAPDDADKSVEQTAYGRVVKHQNDVWTGPRPLISQGDFIVKTNGERYSVGGVRIPTNRGMVLQQHFSIASLDAADVRYRVPIDSLMAHHIRLLSTPKPLMSNGAQHTEKDNIPDERELGGFTQVWENTNY